MTLLRGRDSETLGPRRVATALAADRRHGVQPVLKSLILDLVGAGVRVDSSAARTMAFASANVITTVHPLSLPSHLLVVRPLHVDACAARS